MNIMFLFKKRRIKRLHNEIRDGLYAYGEEISRT